MFDSMSEVEARKYILNQVKNYCEKYHVKAFIKQNNGMLYKLHPLLSVQYKIQ